MNEGEIIHLLKILEVALLAGVKFALAPFEAERQGFNFRDSFMITTLGGVTGIFLFTFIGNGIGYGWKKIKGFFKNQSAEKKPEKKKFTRGNKLIVRIKMKYGLIGLAITTPAIISIPVGSIVINHFYRKKGKNITILLVSLLLWSLVLNGLAQYLKLSQYLPHSQG